MHTTIWRAAGAAVLLALIGVVPSCAIVSRSGPLPGGYDRFELLPVGADLPSGAACARQVTERFAESKSSERRPRAAHLDRAPSPPA